MESGLIIELMDMESLFTLLEIYTMDNGSEIKHVVEVYTIVLIQVELTMENG